jgi:hypothetical protein
MQLDEYDDDVDIFPKQIQSSLEKSGLDLTLVIIAIIGLIALSVLFASI